MLYWLWRLLGNFDLNDYQTISDEAMAEIDATASSDEERAEMIAAAQQLMWRNKALSDTYEPGSTFKIITLAMALEEGVVDMNSSFYCGGSTSVLGRNTPVRCWKSGGARLADAHAGGAAQLQCGLRQHRAADRRGALL